jgi:hypothetical protein
MVFAQRVLPIVRATINRRPADGGGTQQEKQKSNGASHILEQMQSFTLLLIHDEAVNPFREWEDWLRPSYKFCRSGDCQFSQQWPIHHFLACSIAKLCCGHLGGCGVTSGIHFATIASCHFFFNF